MFLSLYYIKCLQYNIRSLPTSETLIPKPQLENHGPKTVHRKTVENSGKNITRRNVCRLVKLGVKLHPNNITHPTNGTAN